MICAKELAIKLIVLLLCSVMIAGCNNGELSRSDVEDDIDQMLQESGFLQDDGYVTLSIKITTNEYLFDKSYSVKPLILRLEKAGYISIDKPHGHYKFALDKSIIPYASLSKNKRDAYFYLYVATYDRIEIEGIEKLGDTKRIVHTRYYFNANDIGEVLEVGDSIKSSITYQLYDDGWRVKSYGDLGLESQLLFGADSGWMDDRVGHANAMLNNMIDFGHYPSSYKKYIKMIKKSKKENAWKEFPIIARVYLYKEKYEDALEVWEDDIQPGYEQLEYQEAQEKWKKNHADFKEEYANTRLWRMHKAKEYSRNYKDLLVLLEKTDVYNYLDTVAHVYCDHGQRNIGLGVYEQKILPSLRKKARRQGYGSHYSNEFKKFEGNFTELKKTCGNQAAQVTNSSHDDHRASVKNKEEDRTGFFTRIFNSIKPTSNPSPKQSKTDAVTKQDQQQAEPKGAKHAALEQSPTASQEPNQPVYSQSVESQPTYNVEHNQVTYKAHPAPEVITSQQVQQIEQQPISQQAPEVNYVLEAQKELKRLKLYHASLDGVQGGGTLRGIKSYQQQMGLAITGAIDQDLLNRMRATPPSAIKPLPKSQPRYAKNKERKTIGKVIGTGVQRTIDGIFGGFKRATNQ